MWVFYRCPPLSTTLTLWLLQKMHPRFISHGGIVLQRRFFVSSIDDMLSMLLGVASTLFQRDYEATSLDFLEIGTNLMVKKKGLTRRFMRFFIFAC
ncbi:hypothetical protein SUGI_0984800 [Cryptomeria japonica]|nr:hypothetical protein SUGI_0984800 [Cryptomeria japonica]